MFFNPDFDALVDEATDVTRTTVSSIINDNGEQVMTIRTTPNRTMPPAMASMLGTDRLIYEQISTFNPATSSLTWRVTPNVMANKVTATGTNIVAASLNECIREVRGEIEVRVPLFGRKIEQAIVQDVTKSYELAAQVSKRWLATM